MLKGSLNVPFGLAKVHPQLTAKDMILIGEIRKEKDWDSWTELFKEFLTRIGEEIPTEFENTEALPI